MLHQCLCFHTGNQTHAASLRAQGRIQEETSLTNDPSTPTLKLTYIDGSLLLVSGQDPDLDVSLHQGLNSLRDTILQLVLDCRGPEQLQVLQQRSDTLQL